MPQIKLSPAAPTSYVGVRFSPSCRCSKNPAVNMPVSHPGASGIKPWLCSSSSFLFTYTLGGRGGWLEYLGACHPRGRSDGIITPWLACGSALVIADIWEMNQWPQGLLSSCLSISGDVFPRDIRFGFPLSLICSGCPCRWSSGPAVSLATGEGGMVIGRAGGHGSSSVLPVGCEPGTCGS